MFTMNKCSRAINCRIALNRKKYLNISLVQSEDFSFCIKFKFMNIFIFFFEKFYWTSKFSSVDHGVFLILLSFQFRMTSRNSLLRLSYEMFTEKMESSKPCNCRFSRRLFPRSAFASLHFLCVAQNCIRSLRKLFCRCKVE